MTFTAPDRNMAEEDRIVLTSVGVDIGSSTSHLLFSRLELERQDNRYVAFGHGIHYCVGAPLAQLEAQIALTTLAQRFPGLALATDEAQWDRSLVFRGLRTLPVTLG